MTAVRRLCLCAKRCLPGDAVPTDCRIPVETRGVASLQIPGRPYYAVAWERGGVGTWGCGGVGTWWHRDVGTWGRGNMGTWWCRGVACYAHFRYNPSVTTSPWYNVSKGVARYALTQHITHNTYYSLHTLIVEHRLSCKKVGGKPCA
ncbi:MAG: hypothetical protein LBL33_06830 [Tannerella sp.]|jgi:hypothetical protein|nr:hypothetical protein [Tannerella sp.]